MTTMGLLSSALTAFGHARAAVSDSPARSVSRRVGSLAFLLMAAIRTSGEDT